MKKLSTFTFTTLNGFYEGSKGDIGWHHHGGEESEYSVEQLRTGNTLLFGRITYEMMKSFWPTPVAMQTFPAVAEGMNNAKKIVFSKTLGKADWINTSVVKGNLVEEVKSMKASKDGANLTLLGSGSILTQLAEHHLIDEYQIMIDPVAIGSGTSIFSALSHKLDLQLTHMRSFKSGVVLLCYEPAR